MQAYGLILAGGKSTRMEGIHKGDLFYRRQTFLERKKSGYLMGKRTGGAGRDAKSLWTSFPAVARSGGSILD